MYPKPYTLNPSPYVPYTQKGRFSGAAFGADEFLGFRLCGGAGDRARPWPLRFFGDFWVFFGTFGVEGLGFIGFRALKFM